MAKYDVTFSCGHTETVELYGKMELRYQKVEWFEKHGKCQKCWNKRIDEITREWEEENGLSEIQGGEGHYGLEP